LNEWEIVFDRADLDSEPVLAVRGEIDVAVAKRLSKELDALADTASARRGRAVIDLSAVGFIDSSGVRELLKTQRRLQSAGGELVLRAPSAPCRRVLDVSGASVEFTISDAPD
jgi:stage II sporulation protein AA (anti-sigma F factor antagonist)